MKILNRDVDNNLIQSYCRVIILMKGNFTAEFDTQRAHLHNEIFKSVGCDRSLYRREDREFNKALNDIVIEMCDLL